MSLMLHPYVFILSGLALVLSKPPRWQHSKQLHGATQSSRSKFQLMPSQSSRTRRSRAPSPESHPSTGAAIVGKLAKGVIEYSLYRLLTRQSSSTKEPTTSTRSPEPMPSRHHRSSRGEKDPTHEIVSHLLRGAAALAAGHFLKKKKERGERGREKVFVPPPPPPPAEQERGLHRHRRRRHRRSDDPSRAELVVALDGLSAELARTTNQIRYLAGGRRPHRHRDGRCDVFEGLRGCADRLEWKLGDVRTGVNNIRNLGVEGGRRREAKVDGGRGEVGADTGGMRSGATPWSGRQGSWERVRDPAVGGRRVRTRGEEDRGRRTTRER